MNQTVDATNNEIIIGERYGYTKADSGFTYVITGTAVAADNGKVTLSDITESTYRNISIAGGDKWRTKKPKNRRTVASVQTFLATDYRSKYIELLRYKNRTAANTL